MPRQILRVPLARNPLYRALLRSGATHALAHDAVHYVEVVVPGIIIARFEQFTKVILDCIERLRKETNERFKQVDNRLDRVWGDTKERCDGIDKRCDGIDKRCDGIDQRLDGIDQRLDGIDQRLDGIDQRLDGIDHRLDGIDKRLDRFETQTMARFDRLEDKFLKSHDSMVKMMWVVVGTIVTAVVIGAGQMLWKAFTG